MTLRNRAGLWVAVGLAVCVVAVLSLRDQGSKSTTSDVAQAATDSAPAAPLLRLAAIDVVGRQQPIRLTADMARTAMRDGELRVALPDGTTYPVRMIRQETDDFGQWSVIGQVDTPVGKQSAVLTFGGNNVFGTLPLPNGHAMRVVTNYGKTFASLGGGMTPPGHGLRSDIAPRPKESLMALRAKALVARGVTPGMAHTTPTLQFAAAAQRVRIDATTPSQTHDDNAPANLRAEPAATPNVLVTVLAAYADDLVQLRGSDAAVQTELSNLIVAASQSHIDSGSPVRFKVVRRQKLDIAPDMENFDALYQMTASYVGDVDTELLRDKYAADLVTFVRPYNDYENCGIAWVAGAGDYGTTADNLLGYSVVNTEPCGVHAMAHELGHNLGSGHDRETDWVDGEFQHSSYPYAFGYRRLEAPAFATIMAYTLRDEPWIGRFSDPNSTACGAQCGVANLADNVRAFKRMAKTVSEFRTVAGQMTISDGEGWESDPGTGQAFVYGMVRLNGYAMTGDVPYHVQIIGGSATRGVDYVADDEYLQRFVVPWGYMESRFRIPIEPDTLVEGDESIIVRITSPSGYPIADDTATLIIRDDDPRPRIRGRLVQDPVPYFAGCYLNPQVWGLNGPRDESVELRIYDNDCNFELPVAPGSNVFMRERDATTYTGNGAVGYRFLPQMFNDVWKDRYTMIPAPASVAVRGHTIAPAGETIIDSQVLYSQSVETWMGRVISQDEATGMCCWWNRSVYPGATLELKVELQAQYKPWYHVFTDVRADTELNPVMTDNGTLIVRGGQPWPEGDAGQRSLVPVEIAMVPGLNKGYSNKTDVRWRTVAGTAKPGVDYVEASGVVSVSELEESKIVWVEVIGNNKRERGRYFHVSISPVTGYNVTNNTTRVTIADDDNVTGGTQQPGKATP